MDVGFNNTNTLHLALNQEFLKDVEWIIEATSEERFNLWKEWHKNIDWQNVNFGWSFNIVDLSIKALGSKKSEIMSVTIEFNFAIINGHKVAFYESNSWVSHYGYIEAFLHTYFQRTHDSYTRWNHVDAGNIHNCFNYLDTIDKEPRDTKYTPDDFESKYHIFKPIKLT